MLGFLVYRSTAVGGLKARLREHEKLFIASEIHLYIIVPGILFRLASQLLSWMTSPSGARDEVVARAGRRWLTKCAIGMNRAVSLLEVTPRGTAVGRRQAGATTSDAADGSSAQAGSLSQQDVALPWR